MSADTPAKDQDKFVLRLPDGMRDRLKAEAEANKRSMNAEIIARIDATLTTESYSVKSGSSILEMINNIDPAAMSKEEWQAQFDRFAVGANAMAESLKKIVSTVSEHFAELENQKQSKSDAHKNDTP